MKRDSDIVERPPRATARCGAGFTLIELLVIVLIMLLMLSILAPAAGNVFQLVERSISKSYIQIIQGGVEMYWNDFRDYPPSTGVGSMRGSQIIAILMTGYDDNDGKKGFGFRLAEKGMTYGPYNGTDELPMSGSPRQFIDRFDNPILYYRFDEAESEYVAAHNVGGPADIDAFAKSGDNYIRADYLLLSPGPDAKWAPGNDNLMGTDDDNALDDITNLDNK